MLLSAFSVLIFSLAWEGWWYMFYIVIGVGIFYLLISNYILKMKTIEPFKKYPDKITWFKNQPAIFTLLIFIVASSILVMLNLGVSGFFTTLINSFGFTNIQSAVQGTSYPNVLVSISELQIPTISDIIAGTGLGAFILGILCVPLLILRFKPNLFKSEQGNKKVNSIPKRKTKPRRRRKKANSEAKEVREPIKTKKVEDPELIKHRRKYLLYIVLFTVWLLITAYTVTKGSRFIEGFAIPISLAAGVFIGLIVPKVGSYIKNAKYCAVAMLIIIAVVAYPSVAGAYSISSSVVPGTDDSMYSSLQNIKNTTSANTVITSWWDFGHLFAVVADRPITFDGASQNNPRAYWVGKALFTDNEALSAGILRMLTTSGDKGYLTLENYTKNTGKSVEILDKILPVDKQSAQTIMVNDYKLSSDQAQNVLQYTHPDNPTPHVFITSSDMLGKAAWWSYFGSWNFQNNTGQHYIYSAAQATSQNVTGGVKITAQNGVEVQVNGTNIDAWLNYNQGNGDQKIPPHKLTVVANNQVIKNEIVSSDSPISIFLIIENNSALAIVMNKELENSMFTRLFIFRGSGLTKFKIASEKPGVTVWNVS